MSPAKNTTTVPADNESEDYTFDGKTGLITMADGFSFSPFDPEATKNLSPARARAAMIERGMITPGPALRLVQEGDGGELTRQEAIEHFAALAVAAEQAAGDLRAEAAKFTAEAESAKAELRKVLEPGKHEVGNLVVSVTEPSRSTDWAAFEKSYPVETNPALYKSVVNSAAVPPNLKEQFMVPGKGERKIAIK